MVYSSKQQPTAPLLVVGHEISFANGDSSGRRSVGNGNGGANQMSSGVVVSAGIVGGDVSNAAGGSSYWNRSPVALNKSSNRYLDQSKAFIEDAYVKPPTRSPYYQQQQHQAMNRHGGYYSGNNSQPGSRTSSMTRPATNRSTAAASAAPMNDDDLSEVSGWKGVGKGD